MIEISIPIIEKQQQKKLLNILKRNSMEDFVTFELAKKLKEKGFDCKFPFINIPQSHKFLNG